MKKIAYYREKVDCPECGLSTNYLQQLDEDGQTVLKCEDCSTEEE
jgi:predicted nucleic acid-binding Zn ribbon protein